MRSLSLAIMAGAALTALAAAAQETQIYEPAEGIPVGALAGGGAVADAASPDNPLAGDAAAVEAGHRLFLAMNCASCHAYGGGGNMGPSLKDASWRYGGTPIQVFKSIADGRSHGMPAWRRALPSNDIWRLVAYIQSLGGMVPAGFYHGGMQGDRPATMVAPGARTVEAITSNVGLIPQAPPASAAAQPAPSEPAPAVPSGGIDFGPRQ